MVQKKKTSAGYGFGLLVLVCTALLPGFRCQTGCGTGSIERAYLISFFNYRTGEAGPEVEVIDPLHKSLAMAVRHKDLPIDSEVRVMWRFLGGPGRKAEPKLFWQSIQVLEGTGTAYFTVPRRGPSWPPGKYETEILLGTKPWGKMRFEVSAASSVALQVTMDPESPVSKKRGSSSPVRLEPGPDDIVYGHVTVLNLKNDDRLRLVWERLDPATGKTSFYAENDKVRPPSSGVLHFDMPRTKNGYCAGRYRLSAFVHEEPGARAEFEIIGPLKGKPGG